PGFGAQRPCHGRDVLRLPNRLCGEYARTRSVGPGTKLVPAELSICCEEIMDGRQDKLVMDGQRRCPNPGRPGVRRVPRLAGRELCRHADRGLWGRLLRLATLRLAENERIPRFTRAAVLGNSIRDLPVVLDLG